jgi:hypothetical protein
MGSHDPFGYLKHTLWPKKRSGVKLPIWFPTTKSQKSPQFPCVQVVCHILLKSSRRWLQLYFRPHFNWRIAHKVMSLQSYEGPNFGNFKTHLKIPGQNAIWVLVPWPNTEYTIRGKVVASPTPGHGESCEFVFACGSSMHQKCFNYALTNLLFGLCRSMWVIELFFNLPNPHPKTLTRPSTPEMLQVKERAPTPYSSIVFTLNLHLSLSRSLGVRQLAYNVNMK